MVTRQQCRKLAQAARELAADCERGDVRFGSHSGFDRAPEGERHLAVVAPLRALADELEAQDG